MKKTVYFGLLLVGNQIFAQLSPMCISETGEIKSEVLNHRGGSLAHQRAQSQFGPLASVVSYTINDNTKTGMMVGFGYLSDRASWVVWEFYGGLLLWSKPPHAEASTVSYHPGYPFASNIYATPAPVRKSEVGIDLGLIGMGVRLYLSRGSISPYLGFGLQGVGWSTAGYPAAAAVPDVKAGVDVSLGDFLTGFAEATRFFGMPTLLGPRSSSLDGITSLAFGLRFSPAFR
jgi:hypothetical protein